MWPNKLKILKFIKNNQPVLPYTIANALYKIDHNDEDRTIEDIQILIEDGYVRTYPGTKDGIRFYELTIKGKDYIDTHKENTFRFYLPFVLSIISLVISALGMIFSLVSNT